jgi:hypothetical protein
VLGKAEAVHEALDEAQALIQAKLEETLQSA